MCQSDPALDIDTLTRLQSPIPEAQIPIPLHAVSGTHHVDMWIGQPPQKQTLIVDTGSRLTATACLPCKDCGGQVAHRANPHYNPQASSTIQTNDCQHCHWTNASHCKRGVCEIVQKYTEGSSWTATEVNDFVFLGDSTSDTLEDYMPHSIPFTFGCQNSVKGLFRKQYANGILGLERSSFSFLTRLYKEQVIAYDAFSLCHTPTAGYLSLGGPLFSHHVEPMRYTPLVAVEGGWYSVHVTSLYVGTTCISCQEPGHRYNPLDSFREGRGTILDSGTTDTYLPLDLAERFEQVWENNTGKQFSESTHAYTYSEFRNLPFINIHLVNNVTITMEPEHYMEGATMEPWTGTRNLTNRVYVDEPGGAVLGLNAMMDYDILFDASHNRVGIAKAHCGKLPITTSG
jgi:hypothetical protein